MTMRALGADGSWFDVSPGEDVVLETGRGERHRVRVVHTVGTVDAFHWRTFECCPGARAGEGAGRSCAPHPAGEYWLLRQVAPHAETFAEVVAHAPPLDVRVSLETRGQRRTLLRLMHRFAMAAAFHAVQDPCCTGSEDHTRPDLEPLPCGGHPGGEYVFGRLVD